MRASTARLVRTVHGGTGADCRTGVTSLVAAPAGNRLTGRFENVPETHDGDAFTVELHFSENIAMTWPTMRDHVLEMTGATVMRVRRLTQGSNQGWELTVTPASREASVGMGITPGRPCDVPGAVCTQNGKGLSNTLGVSIAASAAAGPARLTANFASVPDEHDWFERVPHRTRAQRVAGGAHAGQAEAQPRGDESDLTGVYPYGRHALSERLTV